MDTRDRQYVVARWTDERGENTLAGLVNEDAPRFSVDAVFHPESVVIPDGAVISVPVGVGIPATEVGTIVDGMLV